MKKSIFTLSLFLFVTLFTIAQEVNNTSEYEMLYQKKHELRIDALEGLIVPAIDISYEYVINKYSGVGASIFMNVSSEPEDYQKFAISPYYRQYFFNKKDFGARGFYGEGVLQFAGGSENFFNENGNVIDEEWSSFGVGFAIGQKWVSENGFVIDISLGGGRYFGNDLGPEGFFRGGVTVGYRF